MTTAGPVQLGRYQLVRKLATGGMAEVHLAKAVGPGGFEKSLVIKCILPSLAADRVFVEMFLHEARIAAQLNHPNVVQIFDFGELEGLYYLAMEHIDGLNLRSALRRAPERRMPEPLSARVISLACEGLAHAHEFVDPSTGQPLGLIHRDVSTDNILLSRFGAVKVVDFGIARVAGMASTTKAGTIKGKAAYMPPEQILGEFDLRADVYALGVILYELAAGTRPYQRMPDPQLFSTILKEEPVPLRVRRPEVPEAYAAIVARAMARAPEDRYPSCRALQADLDDFIASTGERVGAQQVAQFVAAVIGSAGAGSEGGSMTQGSSQPSASARSPVALGTGSQPVLATPRTPRPAAGTGAGSGTRGVPAPVAGGLGAPASAPRGLEREASAQRPGNTAPPPGVSLRVPPLQAPEPAAAPARPLPPASESDEARAAAVLAASESIRGYAPGPPLATGAELERLQRELSVDDALSLPVRFALLAPRLAPSHAERRRLLGERLAGVVQGLLLAEAWGPLARALDGLAAAAAGDDPFARWTWESARRALLTPGQVVRLFEVLREAPPADAAGLQQLLRHFGGEYCEAFLQIAEQVDVPASREALCRGLAELAAANPEPLFARLLEPQPRGTSDLAFVLELGRAPDRLRVFGEVAARGGLSQRRALLEGQARAGTDEAFQSLAQALGDGVEALRVHALELLGRHFPSRVLRAVAGLLEPAELEARSPVEQGAIWRALGCSTQPEALTRLAEFLGQRPSLLNRGRVAALKVEALEALAAMRGETAERLLRTVAGDEAQAEPVRAAAERHLAARFFSAPSQGAGAAQAPAAPRRFERVIATPRALAGDLSALAQAGSVLDPADPSLEPALLRMQARVAALVQGEGPLVFALRGGQLQHNGAPLGEGAADAELEQLVAWMAARGQVQIAFDAVPTLEALRGLGRWLAEGEAAGAVETPGIRRVGAPPAPVAAALRGPALPPLEDRTREATRRTVDLVLALRGAAAAGGPLATAAVQEALAGLTQAMASREVRFLGLTPAVPGREAVILHQVNVTLLALGFGAELGLPADRLRALAEYACFHDAGTLAVPEEALARQGELRPGDQEALRAARQASAWLPFERLGRSRRAVEWATAVLELGTDGSAKDERGQARADAGVLGGILALAKTWDTLTSRRAYRAALPPEAAAQMLARHMGARFRPDLLALFLQYAQRQSVRPAPRPG